MDRKDHWDHVYQRKAPSEVSWFQAAPALSMRLLASAGLGPST